jgi:hypothetical protein
MRCIMRDMKTTAAKKMVQAMTADERRETFAMVQAAQEKTGLVGLAVIPQLPTGARARAEAVLRWMGA